MLICAQQFRGFSDTESRTSKNPHSKQRSVKYDGPLTSLPKEDDGDREMKEYGDKLLAVMLPHLEAIDARAAESGTLWYGEEWRAAWTDETGVPSDRKAREAFFVDVLAKHNEEIEQRLSLATLGHDLGVGLNDSGIGDLSAHFPRNWRLPLTSMREFATTSNALWNSAIRAKN